MKKLFIGLVGLLLLGAGCSTETTTPVPNPISDQTVQPSNDNQTKLENCIQEAKDEYTQSVEISCESYVSGPTNFYHDSIEDCTNKIAGGPIGQKLSDREYNQEQICLQEFK